ncbi:ABC transporter ATP-binding protein YtrE [Pseudoalteromonas sp. P1-9]|uniref:ABC transporter ATP-binding protein n=1 Tax=Pseudoalteromonas sp. P1-9 TaxID=1710354 RepID=UPI0006D610EA|nr:ABC transporter ATP-binding protein [Pseudoalteromonas sp. P1-9]KPV93756.1 ABC transporter ATP-binding protein YtrE [Pseudoalteromonas sp. P1-9]
MIKLKKLTRIFRTEEVETCALNAIDLEVKKGEFIAIMGPSGCGKSTLLSILGMLDSPTEGHYDFEEQDIAGYSEQELSSLRKQSIGFVFQSFNLIDSLTVYENVELPLRYQNMSKLEREEKVEKILKRFSIDHRADHLPQQLSGGQQQRVAVARALVIEPKLVLADEPTGNLDSKNGREVMEMLQQLNKDGTTIVMVTHSDRDAKFSDRVVRLLDGKIISNDASSESSSTDLEEVNYA